MPFDEGGRHSVRALVSLKRVFFIFRLTGDTVYRALSQEGTLCEELDHHCSEGSQGKLCNLEELLAERDSDDGYAQQTSEKEVADCKRESADEKPDHIDYERDGSTFVADLAAERAEGQTGQFEALHSDWNTDYGNAPDDACNDPAEAAEKTAEY